MAVRRTLPPAIPHYQYSTSTCHHYPFCTVPDPATLQFSASACLFLIPPSHLVSILSQSPLLLPLYSLSLSTSRMMMIMDMDKKKICEERK